MGNTQKIAAIAGSILLLGTAAINGSRGNWVAIGVGLLLILLIFMASGQRSFFGLAVLLSLVGVFAFVVFSLSPRIVQAVESRLSTFESLDEEKSYTIRLLMNQKSMRLFEQSPIFGVGAGRFRESFTTLDIPRVLQYGGQAYFNRKSAHNSYLSFLAETGLVGTVPYAIFLAYLAIAGLRSAIFLTRQRQYWGVMIYTSFIGGSVHMWVISNLANTTTWVNYGMVAAMIVMVQSMPKENGK